MSKKITKEVLNVIRNLSRSGFTQYYIANTLGISTSLLSKWNIDNPLITEALSVSNGDVLVDVKSRMVHIANNSTDEKASIQASTFLLNRYEKLDTEVVTAVVTDDTIRDEILNDLK